jgi:ethanolamine ammonia-lyase small subunit
MGLSKSKRCELSANCTMQCDVAVVCSKGLSWGSISSSTKDM